MVARITQAHLSCRLVAGHVLTHVASIDLADTKEATYADAKARGLDPAKEFQRAVALELRESPRPLKLSFAGPASDAPRLSCHVALAQFVEGLEPAHLSPQLQVPVLFNIIWIVDVVLVSVFCFRISTHFAWPRSTSSSCVTSFAEFISHVLCSRNSLRGPC